MTETTSALVLLLMLFTKHFIVDFPFQVAYQYKNKGTYGHPGGLLHAFLHAVGTYAVLFWTPYLYLALILAIADGVIHYHIDWAKMNLNAKLGWGPTTHEQFWWLLGFDQYLHALTYLSIIFILVNHG
jgi:hypothetical protein